MIKRITGFFAAIYHKHEFRLLLWAILLLALIAATFQDIYILITDFSRWIKS